MKKSLYMTLLFLLLPVMASASAGLAAGAADISTTPAAIGIGARFDGATLQVGGTVPAGSDVVVRLMGDPAELHLKEKGKVFGLLWMTVGKIAVENVPNVFLVDASRPLDELGKVAEQYRLEGVAAGIQYEDSEKTADLDVPHELLLLKKSSGLYNEQAGGVKMSPGEGGESSFTAELSIPSSLPPGEYKVEAIAIKDGAIVADHVTTVKAELVGFPKSLSDIAFKKSLLYGIGATVIAVVSGLLIGLIFQSKGAH